MVNPIYEHNIQSIFRLSWSILLLGGEVDQTMNTSTIKVPAVLHSAQAQSDLPAWFATIFRSPAGKVVVLYAEFNF